MVVCTAQESKHSSETTAALLFGQACRKITKTARSGANMLAELIAKIDVQVAETENAIKTKERWEVKEEKRKDELAEAGTVEAMGFGGGEKWRKRGRVRGEKRRSAANSRRLALLVANNRRHMSVPFLMSHLSQSRSRRAPCSSAQRRRGRTSESC